MHGNHQTSLATAHPRVSGENVATSIGDSGLGGSSPRERGKPRGVKGMAGKVGLIPA